MNVCIFVFKMEMNRMKKELDIITFDADDTLWENELFFRENELKNMPTKIKFSNHY